MLTVDAKVRFSRWSLGEETLAAREGLCPLCDPPVFLKATVTGGWGTEGERMVLTISNMHSSGMSVFGTDPHRAPGSLSPFSSLE